MISNVGIRERKSASEVHISEMQARFIVGPAIDLQRWVFGHALTTAFEKPTDRNDHEYGQREDGDEQDNDHQADCKYADNFCHGDALAGDRARAN